MSLCGCIISACTAFLFAATPHAFALSPLCQSVLATPPISTHYVGRIVARANEALAAADALPLKPDFAFVFPDWVQSVFSTAVTLVDTTQRLTVHSLSLEDQTSCLAFDALILQCEMEKVLDSLEQSLRNGPWLALLSKQSLLLFLDERLKNLLRGAQDLAYVDTTWGERHFFDPPEPVWCCPESIPGNQCVRTAEGTCPLCPYHTDYFPAIGAFGCDIEVLSPRRAYPPIDADFIALRRISEQVNAVQASSALLRQLEREIAMLTGRTPPPEIPPPPALPPHRVGMGCETPPGFCALNRRQRCTETSTCAALTLGACIIEPGFCSGNVNRPCSENAQCAQEGIGACIVGESATRPRHVLRGPFSLREDVLRLLRRFLDLRFKEGESRAQSDELKLPSEFAPNQMAQRRERELSDPFSQGTRNAWRLLARTWSRIQAALEAGTFPRSTDVPLEVTGATSVLRTEVARLSSLSSTKSGFRGFVTKYAYFLRRSCMFRPCRATLERVLKIADSDDCFPYANGAFLQDTEADPRWRKCARDACLRDVPGLTLPPTCDGIP